MQLRMRVGFLVLFIIGFPLNAGVWAYSGGDGTPSDPFEIATLEDLLFLGATPSDYQNHFKLVADLDLDPNLPGRRVFTQALIAPIQDLNQGVPFFGRFDGNGHVLSNLVFAGDRYLGLFGTLGPGAVVSGLGLDRVSVVSLQGPSGGLAAVSWAKTIHGCFVTGFVDGASIDAGGLVGSQQGGHISSCYTEGAIRGAVRVGGLVGSLVDGEVSDCYSWADVTGFDTVGGLIGQSDRGSLLNCYSVGAVQADRLAGGLMGVQQGATVTSCFWDLERSGQPSGAGGTPATTEQMQSETLYLHAGWDLRHEQDEGRREIWQIFTPGATPRLAEVVVSIPDPTLKLFIEGHLNRANPTRREMLSLTRLALAHGDVTRLVGLEAAHYLEFLDLQSNRIVDLAPLAGLLGLQALDLTNNQISDIASLAGLRELVELGVGGNRVSDLGPLRTLLHLEVLSLHHNQIWDIEALGSLEALEILWIQNNSVADISALLGLEHLVWAQLRFNELDTGDCAELKQLSQQIDLKRGLLLRDHFSCP